MKINISLDDELVNRIDEYADYNYMSRSGLISLACTQYLNANEMTKAIKDMSVCIRKIADNNKLDDDTINKLNELDILCKMLSGRK